MLAVYNNNHHRNNNNHNHKAVVVATTLSLSLSLSLAAFLQPFAILFLLLSATSSTSSSFFAIPVVSAFSSGKTTAAATTATNHQLSSSSRRTTTRRRMATTTTTTTTTTNESKKEPNIPIPEPIYSNVPGTWSYDTMSRRVDEEILQRTYDDNKDVWENNPEFESILKRFNELRYDLQNASKTKICLPLKPKPSSLLSSSSSSLSLSEDSTESEDDDVDRRRLKEWMEWNDILQPYINKNDTWLTAPWMVTEFYLYRRLLIDVIKYWDEYEYEYEYNDALENENENENENGGGEQQQRIKKNPGYLYDPFQNQKYAGLVSSVASAENVLGKINNNNNNNNNNMAADDDDEKDNNNKDDGSSSSNTASDDDDGIKLAASIALWGNKMDLSLWPADASSATKDIFSSILDKAQEGLLNDDSDLLVKHCMKLHSNGGGVVDIIVDNAGFELITDLILGQYLIDSGIATTVRYQLKSHPTFVSDALEKDLLQHINYYVELGDDDDEGNEALYPNCKKSGLKWKQYIEEGKWICTENNFWNQAYPMWKMTEPLRTEMNTNCNLAFIKGDANYRRLLGDCQWKFDDKFQDVVGCYFPCPVCALRTLKAEIGCGIPIEETNRALKLDKNWQTNGRFGVIQFGTGEL